MMPDDEFIAQIRAACDAYGIREFAIYGRFAQKIAPDGMLLPADRYAHCEGELLVAEEAAYHMDRIANGYPP